MEIFDTQKILAKYSKTIVNFQHAIKYTGSKPVDRQKIPSIYIGYSSILKGLQTRDPVFLNRVVYKQLSDKKKPNFPYCLSVSVDTFGSHIAGIIEKISNDVAGAIVPGTDVNKILKERHSEPSAKIVIPKHLGSLQYPQLRVDESTFNVLFFKQKMYTLSREAFNKIIKGDDKTKDAFSELLNFLNINSSKILFRADPYKITFEEKRMTEINFITKVLPEYSENQDLVLLPFLHFKGDIMFYFDNPDEHTIDLENCGFEDMTSFIDKKKMAELENHFKILAEPLGFSLDLLTVSNDDEASSSSEEIANS